MVVGRQVISALKPVLQSGQRTAGVHSPRDALQRPLHRDLRHSSNDTVSTNIILYVQRDIAADWLQLYKTRQRRE